MAKATKKGRKVSHRMLTDEERETVITFNDGEATADIFTYNKAWQKHLEGKLGLKPVMDNGYGGREYQLLKGLIPMPRAKRQYSEQTKKKMATRLAKTRGKQGRLL